MYGTSRQSAGFQSERAYRRRVSRQVTPIQKMDRIFKPPFFYDWSHSAGPGEMAIFFCLTKNPLLYQAAWPESGRERRETFLRAACIGKPFSTRQVVWNRSNRCASTRGGALVGGPR
jgi:hypothetical protein